jgi:hypothetical protein
MMSIFIPWVTVLRNNEPGHLLTFEKPNEGLLYLKQILNWSCLMFTHLA